MNNEAVLFPAEVLFVFIIGVGAAKITLVVLGVLLVITGLNVELLDVLFDVLFAGLVTITTGEVAFAGAVLLPVAVLFTVLLAAAVVLAGLVTVSLAGAVLFTVVLAGLVTVSLAGAVESLGT